MYCKCNRFIASDCGNLFKEQYKYIKFYAVFHLENYAENVVKQEMNHESGK